MANQFLQGGGKKEEKGIKKANSRVAEPWGDACETFEGCPTNRSGLHHHLQQYRSLGDGGSRGGRKGKNPIKQSALDEKQFLAAIFSINTLLIFFSFLQ